MPSFNDGREAARRETSINADSYLGWLGMASHAVYLSRSRTLSGVGLSFDYCSIWSSLIEYVRVLPGLGGESGKLRS